MLICEKWTRNHGSGFGECFQERIGYFPRKDTRSAKCELSLFLGCEPSRYRRHWRLRDVEVLESLKSMICNRREDNLEILRKYRGIGFGLGKGHKKLAQGGKPPCADVCRWPLNTTLRSWLNNICDYGVYDISDFQAEMKSPILDLSLIL